MLHTCLSFDSKMIKQLQTQHGRRNIKQETLNCQYKYVNMYHIPSNTLTNTLNER